MKIVVATPYPEASTLAIARAAAGTGSLIALYASGHLAARAIRLADHVLTGSGVGRYIGRHELTGIPAGLVRECAGAPEVARAVTAHLPGIQGLGSRTMYAAKMAFDREVARRLPGADAVLGIYGSAALTLRAARQRGAITVLNFVNSHPVVQNRLLRDLGGLDGSSHEFVPERVTRRVEREITLADMVLVPSRFVADQLLASGLPSKRIAVIPYGVEVESFSPPADRPAGARVRCLFVGQVSHRKGIPVLLRAASHLPDVEFILTGPVVAPDLLRRLPQNVRSMAPLPHSEVAALMREVDIFVLPSLEDSYGLVVAEAMASGLPVVVTDHVGASEAIEPGITGLVVPAGDDAALAGALRRLVDDASLRTRLGRNARERVLAGHSWAQYGSDVIAAIDQALESRIAGSTWEARETAGD